VVSRVQFPLPLPQACISAEVEAIRIVGYRRTPHQPRAFDPAPRISASAPENCESSHPGIGVTIVRPRRADADTRMQHLPHIAMDLLLENAPDLSGEERPCLRSRSSGADPSIALGFVGVGSAEPHEGRRPWHLERCLRRFRSLKNRVYWNKGSSCLQSRQRDLNGRGRRDCWWQVVVCCSRSVLSRPSG
jgi:hypothetical protein